MKKTEFLSIKECVKSGQYEIINHSYGTSSMGYLTNYKLIINNKEHENKFNRKVYYICFSSKSWFKVKHEGVFYNNHFLPKYEQYDKKIESVLFGSDEVLSEKLHA